MCLNSSRLLKSSWTPGIGIQNHLSGQLPWIRSWRNCNGAGKPLKTSSRDAPCRVHEKGGKNNSSRLGDTTLALAGFLSRPLRFKLVKSEAVYFLLETVDPWTVLAMKASFFEFRSEHSEQLLAQVK